MVKSNSDVEIGTFCIIFSVFVYFLYALSIFVGVFLSF